MILINQRDATYEFGKKCIDSILASIGVILKVESVKMTKYSKIVIMDYQEYLIDININEYFNIKTEKLDKIYHSKLDSERKSHRKKFVKGIEQLIIDNDLDTTI